MNLCAICKNPIPWTSVIDGKVVREGGKRKHCYNCVPYGKGLTGPHETRKNPNRVCKECGEQYIRKRNTSLDHCMACRRRLWLHRRKQKLIDLLGGKCVICGYNRSIAALDFHHREKTEKEFNIGHIMADAIQKVLTEIAKCVILCSNCHRELHAGIVTLVDDTPVESPHSMGEVPENTGDAGSPEQHY